MKTPTRFTTRLFLSFFSFTAFFIASGVSSQTPALKSLLLDDESNYAALQLDRHRIAVTEMEATHGPFDSRLSEALQSLALLQQNVGDLEASRRSLDRVLHLSRVNEGLNNESQIETLNDLIGLSIELSDWEAVNRHFGYLEHLYLKLYPIDDPRREQGLRMVVNWHVDAWNANIDDQRPEHMKNVKRLFHLRLQSAKAMPTQNEEHIHFLRTNIAISQRLLNVTSGIYKERRQQYAEELRDRYLATLD